MRKVPSATDISKPAGMRKVSSCPADMSTVLFDGPPHAQSEAASVREHLRASLDRWRSVVDIKLANRHQARLSLSVVESMSPSSQCQGTFSDGVFLYDDHEPHVKETIDNTEEQPFTTKVQKPTLQKQEPE